MLIVFIIVILTSFIYTNIYTKNNEYSENYIEISGVVKFKTQKDNYNEYSIENFLVRDYNKNQINTGDVVKIYGKIKNYTDFNLYLKSKGYKALINLNKYEIIDENIFYKRIGDLKENIKDTTRYLYKKNSDFLNALLLGQKQDLDDTDIFSITGTSHIIAISGLHIGIFSTLIIFILGKIYKIYKLIILFFIISLYGVMVGSPPSIIRAIGCSFFIYIAFFIDRKNDHISTLSLIGIILIINNPYIIYNISFQLSFLATLSITYFYKYINNVIKNSTISVTISANILTLPILYYNFGQISLISIISNLIVIPFIGIIMYLGILSIILFKINIFSAKIISKINTVIINMIYLILDKMRNFKFACVYIDNPNIFFVIIYYIIVFSYMIFKETKVIKEQENELQGYY